jgi:hypothetical protein
MVGYAALNEYGSALDRKTLFYAFKETDRHIYVQYISVHICMYSIFVVWCFVVGSGVMVALLFRLWVSRSMEEIESCVFL